MFGSRLVLRGFMTMDERRRGAFYFNRLNSARKLMEHLARRRRRRIRTEKEIFPKTAFFGSFTIMRIEWRGKEGRQEGRQKDTRKSQEAISYANRRLTETEVFKEALEEEGEGEEVELGEGEKELSFPLSFIVFSGLFGWSLSSPLPLLLSPLGKDSFLQLLLRQQREPAADGQIDRCLRGSGIRRH